MPTCYINPDMHKLGLRAETLNKTMEYLHSFCTICTSAVSKTKLLQIFSKKTFIILRVVNILTSHGCLKCLPTNKRTGFNKPWSPLGIYSKLTQDILYQWCVAWYTGGLHFVCNLYVAQFRLILMKDITK